MAIIGKPSNNLHWNRHRYSAVYISGFNEKCEMVSNFFLGSILNAKLFWSRKVEFSIPIELRVVTDHN